MRAKVVRMLVGAVSLVAIAPVIVSHAIGAEPAFACIEELTIPKYPPLAQQARLQESVEVRIRWAGQSEPDRLVLADNEQFRRAVIGALDASRFSSSCAHDEVTIVFRFELDMSARQLRYDGGTAIIRWPGAVIIRAFPPPVMP